MCDYSLHHVANRPAKIEDKLVTTKFKKSITRGFAAVGQPNVAVCLLPGTEIAFDENVECEPSFGIGILATTSSRRSFASPRFRSDRGGLQTLIDGMREEPPAQPVACNSALAIFT